MKKRYGHQWTTAGMAKRVRLYTGYIGCGCSAGDSVTAAKHSVNCARGDFWRLATELMRRTREVSP